MEKCATPFTGMAEGKKILGGRPIVVNIFEKNHRLRFDIYVKVS